MHLFHGHGGHEGNPRQEAEAPTSRESGRSDT
jgi:hypothetical protein